ncbi:helix-turn-helix domain-containing protein [Falsigemmobacter intermedius]|nr:helix-turn-helix domain-containing protein [Falsigemmobacter intermedius]
MASTLDTDKLRKVRALMDGGKTEGERSAAKGKAEALAARAGLTLKEALSSLDGPDNSPGNFFAGFDDWMEAKEPGYKAEQARRRADREAKRLARCKELLAEYGSREAVFAPTDTEARLRDALASFRDDSMYGYRGFSFSQGPTPEMWQAMREAVAVPDTVHGAWAAHQAHEARQDDRFAFCPDYTPWEWEEAWASALGWLLDNLPSTTAQDMTARLEWLRSIASSENAPCAERFKSLAASLCSDMAALLDRQAQGMSRPDGGSTQAQRRAAVLDLLAMGAGISDREIARRVGCSPQTVGNIRRRAAA